MAKHVDITGQKFGRLTALEFLGNKKWRFQCDCGKIVIADSSNVKFGTTKSCGCLNDELRRSRRVENPVKKNRHYMRWRSMIQRCSNKKDKEYKNYGGRGIKVCDEWKTFNGFLKWAESSGFQEGLTIDRINPDGDYCPENCRWATNTEQQRNRRCTVLIEHNGEKKCLSEWAEKYGVCPENISRAANGKTAETLDERMNRYETIGKNEKLIITIKGESKTIKEWEMVSGTPSKIIRHRLERGWTPERAIYKKVRGRVN